MTIYLQDIPLPEANLRLENALRAAGLWERLGSEEIELNEGAVGRVLAEPAWAKISSPHYHASAMDGFAVRSGSTSGATLADPVVLVCSRSEAGLDAAYCDTGDPLPDWADAVIPIEFTEPVRHDGTTDQDSRHPWGIRIRAALPPWQNIRPMGEDMVATQLVLPGGHVLRPIDLGALAASGHTALRVASKPRVAIIPTGSELKPLGEPVAAGDIIEFNSIVLAGQVNGWGGVATRLPIAKDDEESIQQIVQEAAQDHDLILLNAGSSAGSEDFSARVISVCGEVFVHGVAVRPGHPVIIGMVRRGEQNAAEKPIRIPIFGVPGYPVSAALTAEIFIEPLLARWTGRTPSAPQELTANLTRKINSPGGDDDYIRVVLGNVKGKLQASPLSRGSGVITSLVRADGILIVPRGTQGLQAGSEVSVRLYRQPKELERTILAIGSHDMALDLMAQYLASQDRRLASSNAGSLGGLIALRRGEAHMAGSHLLDPASGTYNIKYIQEYLPGIPVKVVRLFMRDQGLILAKGNPKMIAGLRDIARGDVRIVNRQRGAGTRVLLDYQLEKLAINTEHINGYLQEEYTHLAVAASIASGRADCGMGIAAAAHALGLDFLPLYKEPYEMVIPAEFYESDLLQPFLELLFNPEFSAQVAGMPGYDVAQMGQVVAELNNSR